LAHPVDAPLSNQWLCHCLHSVSDGWLQLDYATSQQHKKWR